jgi:hypothetical protein
MDIRGHPEGNVFALRIAQAGTPHRLWDRDVNQRVGRSQTWVLTEVGSMLDFPGDYSVICGPQVNVPSPNQKRTRPRFTPAWHRSLVLIG